MNEMPYVIPNFMPFNNPNNYNNSIELKKELENINHELEQIEKRLAKIENNINSKYNNSYSSNVNSDNGLYMI